MLKSTAIALAFGGNFEENELVLWRNTTFKDSGRVDSSASFSPWQNSNTSAYIYINGNKLNNSELKLLQRFMNTAKNSDMLQIKQVP